ncbi:MAG: hypothetical protein N3A69_16960 [Leptospiraceae bacterium]|nr:hypothetical protein [Leptospiraceae bacterium]
MLYRKEEWEKIPLEERWKLEASKIQNSPIYWLNEYINAEVPSAGDVKGLIQHTKNVTQQLESLYSQLEILFAKYQVTDLDSLEGYIENLKDQVEVLYQEKEESLNRE